MGASCSEEYQPTEGWAVSRYPRSCPEPLELVDLKFYWSSMRLLLQRDESWNDGRTPSALARGVSDSLSASPTLLSCVVLSIVWTDCRLLLNQGECSRHICKHLFDLIQITSISDIRFIWISSDGNTQHFFTKG